MSDADKILAFLEEHWPKINKNEADLEKYFPAKRSNAEIETQRDLQKDIKHLLADIHDESLADQSRSREMTVSRTMARFASLLAVLSFKADEQTRHNLAMQDKVVRLTWGLFWLTIAICFVAAVQTFLLISEYYAGKAP